MANADPQAPFEADACSTSTAPKWQPPDFGLMVCFAVARSYPKPLEAVKALREDAVARNLGAGFNSLLSQLADRCAPLRSGLLRVGPDHRHARSPKLRSANMWKQMPKCV